MVVAQTAPAPTLDIMSRPPGAHVVVDGELLRTPTPIHAETFASGMHKVLVDKKGYTPRELAVQLGDGEHRTLDVELRPGARRVVRVVQQKVPQGYPDGAHGAVVQGVRGRAPARHDADGERAARARARTR